MSQRARQERLQHQTSVRRLVVSAVAVLLLVTAAVLLYGRGARSGDGGSSDGEGAVRVSMTEFAFDPDPIVLESGDDARLEVVNDGQVVHDLVVAALGKGTPDMAPGQEMVLDLSGQPPGNYRVVCDLPGHVEAGMVTELILG